MFQWQFNSTSHYAHLMEQLSVFNYSIKVYLIILLKYTSFRSGWNHRLGISYSATARTGSTRSSEQSASSSRTQITAQRN